jgi:nucleoside-diphosphate-sugar epimerase
MKNKLSQGVLLRVGIDIVVLTTCLLAAFLIRFAYSIGLEGPIPSGRVLLGQYFSNFAVCVPLIVSFALVSFVFFGLYSRVRSYRWQVKLLTISKAVAVPYLLVPLTLFLLPEVFTVPRSVLFLAWGLTWAATLLGRLWSNLWRSMLMKESGSRPTNIRDERKVLLIGGAGYIGSSLVQKLLEAGYKVRLLDLFMYGKEPLGESVKHRDLELVEGDFRQADKVVAAMRDVGAVIHLGGLVGDPACALDERLTLEINLVATRLIAQVAKGEGVKRFVFASTCSVYGACDGILDESSQLNPVSLYARSKIASEQVLLDMRDDSFAPAILRFGTIFGLSGRTRFDLVVNLLTAKAVFDRRITLYGGDQWRPFVHVDDAALAVLTILQAPIDRVDGEVFNIGGDNLNYTLQQVGEIIQRMVPNSELVDLGANGDRRNYRVDFAKARLKLGFTPKWKLEQGIAQVINAIKEGVVQDYTLSRYSNVKFLSHERIQFLGKDSGWEKRLMDGVGPSEDATT